MNQAMAPTRTAKLTDMEGASLLPGLVVEIGGQIFSSDLVVDAFRRNVDFGDPQQGVQHDLSLVRISPVRVRVAAGEAEASAAVGTLVGPHHRFCLAAVGDDVIVRPLGADV